MPKAAGPRPKSTLTREVGERVRSLREARGLSLRELARRLGTSPAAVSYIETGERAATVTTLDSLARALSVSAATFFTPDESRPRPRGSRVLAALVRKLEGRSDRQLAAIDRLVTAFDEALDADREPSPSTRLGGARKKDARRHRSGRA